MQAPCPVSFQKGKDSSLYWTKLSVFYQRALKQGIVRTPPNPASYLAQKITWTELCALVCIKTICLK